MPSFIYQQIHGFEFTIHKGTDINDSEKKHGNWIYRAILTDESGKEYGRAINCGQRDPLWNYSDKVLSLDCPPKFMLLEVVEEHCFNDPGTSKGSIVRGRAVVDIPRSNRPWTQKIELHRNDGFKRAFGGFVYFTSRMWKEPLWNVLESAADIGGLTVQKLSEFLLDSAEELGLNTARLGRLLWTNNPNGLSLSILAERVVKNADVLPNRKRRNHQENGAVYP